MFPGVSYLQNLGLMLLWEHKFYKYKNGDRMKQRVIFHIDVNSAFLSWSAVEHLRQGGTTDYRTINAAIAKEGMGKSIVLAKSEGAKKLGVSTGEPVWLAKEKCPNLAIINPDYRLYLRFSNAMQQLFFDYTPLVEQFSIDECFLDMTGQEKFFGAPEQTAYDIKERIKKELGFTVNVGIGDNKPLAKMASELKKPDLVHTLWRYEVKTKLWPRPIEFLFMAGRQSVKKLQRIGIDTVGKLASIDRRLINQYMGKQGDMLYRYANGIDNEPVVSEVPPPKSVSQSITLPLVFEDIAQAEPVFVYIAEYLSAKLRRLGFTAGMIYVGVKDRDRVYHGKQRQTAEPLLHRRIIFHQAMELLQELWPSSGVRYVGIGLGDLQGDRSLEPTLFDDSILREERLDDAVYRIKQRYGNESLYSCCLLNSGVKEYFRDIGEETDGLEAPRFF